MENSYDGKLSLRADKYLLLSMILFIYDLLHLSQFSEKPQAKDFYKSLTSNEELNQKSDEEFVDNSPQIDNDTRFLTFIIVLSCTVLLF